MISDTLHASQPFTLTVETSLTRTQTLALFQVKAEGKQMHLVLTEGR